MYITCVIVQKFNMYFNNFNIFHKCKPQIGKPQRQYARSEYPSISKVYLRYAIEIFHGKCILFLRHSLLFKFLCLYVEFLQLNSVQITFTKGIEFFRFLLCGSLSSGCKKEWSLWLRIPDMFFIIPWGKFLLRSCFQIFE